MIKIKEIMPYSLLFSYGGEWSLSIYIFGTLTTPH